MRLSTVAILVFAFVSFASQSWAQEGEAQRASKRTGTLIEFDGPNISTEAGLGTQPLANNDLGVVVGYYVDTQIIPHGFLRTPEGKIVSFDAPGADLNQGDNGGTVAYAINDLGVITGQFEDTSFVFHGFIRYPDGHFTAYDVPDAGSAPGLGTIPANINLQGDTAGYYYDDSQTPTAHGFIRYHDGRFVTIDPPGSLFTMVCLETCLNSEGSVTGYFLDGNGTHGFVRSPDGQLTVIDTPEAEGGTSPSQFTIAASINAQGAITGYSTDSSGFIHGFIRSPQGNLTFFEDPSPNNSEGTGAFAINVFGATTGEYLDSNSESHGFLRSADGQFANFDAPDAGPVGTRPSTLNAFGQVTGWYVDASGVLHGFVWNPGLDCFSDAGVVAKSEGEAVHALTSDSTGRRPTLRDLMNRLMSPDKASKLILEKWLANQKQSKQ